MFLAAAGLALVGAGLQLAALYRGSYGLLLVGAALQVRQLVKAGVCGETGPMCVQQPQQIQVSSGWCAAPLVRMFGLWVSAVT